MARDIEEFLRRAAERRKQQQQNQPPAQPRKPRRVVEAADIEIVDPIQIVEPVQQNPPRRLQQQAPARRRTNLRDQSVSEHVRQHIDTSDVSEHAEHLGERIQRADDVISQRIQRKFDHDVGRLEDMPTVQDDEVAAVTEDASSKMAAELLQMLSKPESVRQAILISEILNRPNFD